MNATLAIGLAQLSTMITYVSLARWYVLPWLKGRTLRGALSPLVAVHLFRGLALQLYSAQADGFGISNAARDHNIIGDMLGMALALTALGALRFRLRYAIALVWLLVIETLLDIASGLPTAIKEHAMGSATGVTWLVLVYFAPAVMLSSGLIVWQLIARRRESVDEPGLASAGRLGRAAALTG